MNKKGFDCARARALHRALDCALSFRRFFTSLSPFFSSFSPPYYPGFLRFFFFYLSCTPSGFELLTFRIHLAYQSFFYTTTPRDSVEVYSPKTNVYSTSIAFVGPWRIKSGGDNFFLSHNRLHLSCSSRFVFVNYINTQCLR